MSEPPPIDRLVPPEARVEKTVGGMRFTEGPVWVARDRALIFSDIPADQLKRWSDEDDREGKLTTFREPSHQANGNTLDRDGRLVTCEHASRRVTRTEHDGTVSVLVDRFEGKRFNSPNDVVVRRDGTIWFTDPPYGLPRGASRELEKNHVFRFDPATRDIRIVADDFDMPNGLCFSPDEKTLYIADSGTPHHIRAFNLSGDGRLANGRIFCTIDSGAPDGIRCDEHGNIWSSAGDGVHVFAPDGTLLGKIPVPETPANLCFGGDEGKTLFITARTSLYRITVNVRGAGGRR
jgi:gluconolactonase